MRPPVASLVFLLAACASPGNPRRNELVERAELQDAWLATAVPFGLAALLVLVVVVMRHERGDNVSLRWLFESHRLPDVGRWWSERQTRRAREREARRAERAALAAELERRRAALPPPPVLGPSTMGFGRRFLVAFAAHGMVFFAAILHFASGVTSEWTALVVVVLTAGAAIVSILASGACALLVTALPRRHPAIATACGALSTALTALLVPVLADVGLAAALTAGVFAGFLVGSADENSRKPIGAAPAAGGADPAS